MATVSTIFSRIMWLQPEALVLSSLIVVGAAGVVAGLFLRVPAVLTATAVAIAYAVITSVFGQSSVAELLVSVMLHVGVLQAAYLATLLATSLWTRTRTRDR